MKTGSRIVPQRSGGAGRCLRAVWTGELQSMDVFGDVGIQMVRLVVRGTQGALATEGRPRHRAHICRTPHNPTKSDNEGVRQAAVKMKDNVSERRCNGSGLGRGAHRRNPCAHACQ